MKVLMLNRVHYLTCNGLTLSSLHPVIEATEENLNKMSKFIKSGYVKVVETEEKVEAFEDQEAIKSAEAPKVEEEILNDYNFNGVERFSAEDLEELTKEELFDKLDEQHIEYKKSMKKDDLIELLVK